MSLYCKAYKPANMEGPGDGKPKALQFIEDESVEGTDTDRFIPLMGSSSRIEIETTRALAATVATLSLGARFLPFVESALGCVYASEAVEQLTEYHTEQMESQAGSA
ncbi:hypothetical protein BJ170DRAFT_682795 [Xylariales sp. AK1849]|nr:hypothetical protein BJ170DRAFT_682795 [Xylariales sp. AK1849]